MVVKINAITGATGLLGSHIAEQLVAKGERVRALVRPSSEVSFLRHLGVELVPGDLDNTDALRELATGAATFYHCASRVGDYGTRKQFHAEVVETTRHIMDACRAALVDRVLHVSSVAVYGHRPRFPPDGLGEDHPQPRGLRLGDNYGRAKMQAEEVARSLVPGVTMVRPTWMYGPRDRHGFPRLLRALRGRWVSLVGSGEHLLNIIHAGDVAAGAILAANHPSARGQVYHLCSQGEVTQRQFLDALADSEGLPHVTKRFPFRLAYFGGFLGEIIARLLRFDRAPFITRYSVARMGRPAAYRIDKARNELGWSPRVKFADGLRETLTWLRDHQA